LAQLSLDPQFCLSSPGTSSPADFKSVLTYLPGKAPEDFVSLTMPVRTESYVWDDQLPPVFQMNLPEGYLLRVLQEQFGPQTGANPASLLSVIGRNMVGRVQIAAPRAVLEEPPNPIEVAELLQGDNSEQAFAELVRQHATSGVSGILPKLLDTDDASDLQTVDISATLGLHPKATLLTRRHIIKGSSSRLPFAALNEYLCMQVVAKVLPSAKIEVSCDGNAPVPYRIHTVLTSSFDQSLKHPRTARRPEAACRHTSTRKQPATPTRNTEHRKAGAGVKLLG
jgi:serine/threonine-protein kinase HipA